MTILGLSVLLVVGLGLLPGVAVADGPAEVDLDEDLEGDGTAEYPYVITNVSELQAIEQDLGAHFVLGSDIDASSTVDWNDGEGFEPIGEDGDEFTGVFDGQGYEISDLFIDRPGEWGQGMFFSSNGSEFRNLRLTAFDITSGGAAGTLLSQTWDGGSSTGESSTIDGVHVSHSTVDGTNGWGSGGLVGVLYNPGDVLTNSSVKHTSVRDDGGAVGGVVGEISGSDSATELRALAVENVTVTSDSDYAGGFVGYFSAGNATVYDSYVLDSAVEGGNQVGGFVGFLDDSVTIAGAYVRETTMTGTAQVGGFAGHMAEYQGGSTIQQVFVTGTISGDTGVGALVGEMDAEDGELRFAYWNNETVGGLDAVAGQASGAEVTDVEGLTTDEMQGSTPESAMLVFNWMHVWDLVEDDYPALQWEGAENVLSPAGTYLQYAPPSRGSILYSIDGVGTDDDPYQLTSVWELQAIEADLSAHYELGTDIDASSTVDWNDGEGFEPIGEVGDEFTGVFDGQGYEISGLVIDRPEESSQGLFSSSNGGEFRNVQLTAFDITSNGETGALLSQAWDGDSDSSTGESSTIDTVHVSYSTVNGTDAWGVGGLVGLLYNPGDVLTNSSVRHTSVRAENGYVGGVVGEITGTDLTVELRNLAVENVTVTGDSDAVGGFAGYVNAENSTISDSYVMESDVEGQKPVGGFVGSLDNEVTIAGAYVRETTITGSDQVGGFAGYMVGFEAGSTIQQVFVTGTVSGDTRVGALVGDLDAEDGELRDAYWNTETVGGLDAVGEQASGAEVTDVEGLNTAKMQQFTPKITMEQFDYSSTWTLTSAYPRLAWEGFAPITVDAVVGTDRTATAGVEDQFNVTAIESGTNAGEGVNVTVVANDSLTGLSEGLTVVTDVNGNATFTINETSAADYDLEFAWADDSTVNDSATVTVESANATFVTVETQPAESTAGQPISGPPTVSATDSFGNPVDGVIVSVSEEGGYTFDSATTGVETVDGLATFDDLVINTSATAYRLNVSISATDQNVSKNYHELTDEFTVSAADAETLEIVDAPVVIDAGEVFTLTTSVTDQFGNPIEGDEVSVALNDSIELFGTTTVETNNSGIAAFDTLSVETAGTYTLEVTNETGVLDVASNAVEVEPAAIERVELDPDEDQELVPGETVAFDATAVDEFGNANETANEAFEWTNTSAEGVFENTSVGTYEVTATIDDVRSPTTNVTILGPANFSVSIDEYPTSVVEGDAVAVEVTITNVGGLDGTQNVTLSDFDGDEVDTELIPLGGSEETSSTLVWQTNSSDLGTGTVTVTTDNESVVTGTIEVSEPSPTPSSNPASFDVTIDAVTDNVTEGEILTVSVTIENSGDRSDTQAVTVSNFEGDVVNTTDVSLSGGEQTSRSLRWVTTIGDAGAGSLTVESDDDSATTDTIVILEQPAVAFFELSALDVPSAVEAGEAFDVDVVVTNTGDHTAEQPIVLSIDAVGIEESTLRTLQANETETITFEAISVDSPGVYTVDLSSGNASISGSVHVSDEGVSADDQGSDVGTPIDAEAGEQEGNLADSDELPGFGVILTLFALLITALFSVRRRQ